MKSDSLFIRWGIPGWMVAVSFTAFMLLDYFSANDSTIFNAINGISLDDQAVWWLIIAGFLIAGAGIPLGFIIYQIYFYFRWVSPASKDGFLPPLINGRMKEMNDSLKELDPLKLGLNIKWRKNLIASNQDHRSVWHYISPFLHEVYLELDKDGILRSHTNYLKETIHSLGASYLGIAFGYIMYLITKSRFTNTSMLPLGYAIIVTIIIFFLLSLEDNSYKNKSKNGEKYSGDFAEIFLGSLIFIYGTLNPGLNREFHNTLWGILVCGGIFIGYSLKEQRWFIIILTTGLLLASFYVYNSPLYNLILKNIDWPNTLSIIGFEFLTIVFLKIRQNTIDQLTSFQYHLTMMYLTKPKK